MKRWNNRYPKYGNHDQFNEQDLELDRVSNVDEKSDSILNDDSTIFEIIKQKLINYFEFNDDFIKRIIPVILIVFFTGICTLCFPCTFFKIIFILEMLFVCSLGILYMHSSKKDSQEFIINKLDDGFDIIEPSKSKFSLDELIMQEPVEELKELLAYVKSPNEPTYELYKPERKLIIDGETGSGKDTLIKAFAHDANLPIVHINASRFLDVENIFDYLIKFEELFSSFVLQIDAFESLIGETTETPNGMQNTDIIIDKLNAYLNSFENIILFATCEDISELESSPSAMRMFKKAISIGTPDKSERIKLLTALTSGLNLNKDVDFEAISKNCIGLNVGDIKYLVSATISNAHKNNRDEIIQSDFFEASDSLEYGFSNKKHSKESQKIVAYHEAGHALVQYLLSGKHSVLRVISTTRGDAGGVTLSSFDEEKIVLTQTDLINRVCCTYAGRCSEKLIFNHLSTGASADIQMATDIILNMIRSYGMCDAIGPINVSPKIAIAAVLNESSDMLNLISKECIKLARECEEKTTNLLKEHINELHTLAQYLIEHESITGEEMENLLKDIEDKQ